MRYRGVLRYSNKRMVVVVDCPTKQFLERHDVFDFKVLEVLKDE